MAGASTNQLVIKNGFKATGNSQVTGSLNASSGFVGALTGTASFATLAADSNNLGGVAAASYALSTAIAGFATTGSNTFAGNQSVTGNVNITGTLTANTYIVSSSLTNMTVAFASGSTAFGNSSDDTHNFTGSLSVLGSINAGTGGITGSFKGDGSGLTGVTATAVFPASQTTPILSTTKLFSNDGSNTFVYVGQVTGSTYAGVSGDVTIGTGGVAAIGSGKVTSAMIVDGTITGTDIAAGTVANSNLVNSGSILGSTPLVLGSTVTTVTGLASVTSGIFAVTGSSGYLGVNSISKTFADSFTIVSNTANQVVLALDAANGDLPFNSIHIKYVMVSQGATNIRAGSIIIASNANSSGTDVVIAETSTQDIGDTSLIDFTATVSGTTVRLVADSTGFGSANAFKFEYTLM